MDRRIREHTVGELARAAGASVRTLHHYDALGLLRPAHVAANGYRLYGPAEAARLQEILLWRAAGVPLAGIGALIDGGGDRAARLRAHRGRLVEEAARIAAMIATVDLSLRAMEEETDMDLDDLYRPFPAEKQVEYEDWLVATYGGDMQGRIAAAKAAMPDPAPAMRDLRGIEAALVAAFGEGRDPAAEIAAHRRWVARMWGRDCTDEAYAGLADLYLSHPDFVARYEALAPGFSRWLPARMKAAPGR